MLITSPQNPRIKRLVALTRESHERRRNGVFVVEGRRELAHCVAAGYRLTELYVCPQICGDDFEAFSAAEVFEVFEVTPRVYERIAYRGGTEGVVACVQSRGATLAHVQVDASARVVVLEGVEKPGNVGAVLRSADAAGATAVIMCDCPVDLYNPNLIRASLGSVFTVPCVECGSEECIKWLKANGIQILTAQLQDSVPYYGADMRRPTAIVLGTEATGLTQQWREAADAHIRIPMLGRLDSLNVSVTAAILLYESVRQTDNVPTQGI